MPIALKGDKGEEQFLFRIAGKKLRVIDFAAQEQMSHLFQVDLTLATKDEEIKFDDVIGNEALLTIRGPEADRYFHGIINRFVLIGGKGPFFLYRAQMVPRLWLLTLERDCRIFQDKTTRDIIEEVLKNSGITGDICEFRLKGKYQKREYCVQYRETDFNFISRLVEEDGVFYFFEHLKNKHILVFGDSTVNYKNIEKEPKVKFRATSGLAEEEEFVFRFTKSRQIRSGKMTINDFNYEKPLVDLTSSEQNDYFKMLEVYDYPGRFKEQGEGKSLSKVRLEQSMVFKDVGEGASACVRFTPGLKFRLDEHGIGSFNAEYLLYRIHHQGTQPQSLEEHADTTQEFSYANQFMCIPSEVVFRPERNAIKPVVEGHQTAMVVGPKGEEIYTDKHGRVKIQFHWDREGKYDENSSLWVRVAQTLSGKAWGTVFLPRIGHEVIVDFEEGDPDRPCVIGSLYNGEAVTPYPLPDDKTRSTIKSRSSIGGEGYNEIRFEDKKGSEQVFIHAENRMDTRVKGTLFESIGGERHEIVTKDKFSLVEEDKHIIVRGDHKEKVEGSISIQSLFDMDQDVGFDYKLKAGFNIHQKCSFHHNIEAGIISIKAGPSFINLGPMGIDIVGPIVNINSGGAADSADEAEPDAPEEAKPAATAPKPKKVKTATGKKVTREIHVPNPVVIAQAKALKNAAASGTPFCAKCQAAGAGQAGGTQSPQGGGEGGGSGAGPEEEEELQL